MSKDYFGVLFWQELSQKYNSYLVDYVYKRSPVRTGVAE